MNNKTIIGLLSASVLIFTTGCDVSQTREAKLPDIDVDAEAGQLPEFEITQTQETELPSVDMDVEGGQLPAFDVELADVDVGTTTETIKVPKVKLVVEEETFEVPYIDVTMPDDVEGEPKMRQEILASVETPNPGYKLQIQKVYIIDEEIAVMSKLIPENVQEADGNGVASDALVINAPKTEINHYVITQLDDVSGRNGDYTFSPVMSEFDLDVDNGQLIYAVNQ